MKVKLRHLKSGQIATICGYENSTVNSYRSKLLSFGLTKGTTLKVVRVAPLGDPLEIEIRGFHLTLRKEESDCLILEGDLFGSCSACGRC